MTGDFEMLTEEEVKLYLAKNADYSQGGDPLGNFKRVAAILSNYPNLKLDNPTVVAIVFAMKQVDACLWMINKGYEGKVESIDTRLQDVHIYMKLARILEREKTLAHATMADDEFRQSATPKKFMDPLLKIIQQGGATRAD